MCMRVCMGVGICRASLRLRVAQGPRGLVAPTWGSLRRLDGSAIVPPGKALQDPSTRVVGAIPSHPPPKKRGPEPSGRWLEGGRDCGLSVPLVGSWATGERAGLVTRLGPKNGGRGRVLLKGGGGG